jgi:ABC-type proline/glycine betaine transport system permease subunit
MGQLVLGGLAVAALAVITEVGFTLAERRVRRAVGSAA